MYLDVIRRLIHSLSNNIILHGSKNNRSQRCRQQSYRKNRSQNEAVASAVNGFWSVFCECFDAYNTFVDSKRISTYNILIILYIIIYTIYPRLKLYKLSPCACAQGLFESCRCLKILYKSSCAVYVSKLNVDVGQSLYHHKVAGSDKYKAYQSEYHHYCHLMESVNPNCDSAPEVERFIPIVFTEPG